MHLITLSAAIGLAVIGLSTVGCKKDAEPKAPESIGTIKPAEGARVGPKPLAEPAAAPQQRPPAQANGGPQPTMAPGQRPPPPAAPDPQRVKAVTDAGAETPLGQARTSVEDMATELNRLVGAMQAAAGDKTKIMAIQQTFTERNKVLEAKAKALMGQLQPGDAQAIQEYAKARLMPVMQKLMPLMMGAQQQPSRAPAP